jgi:hypothetical protein
LQSSEASGRRSGSLSNLHLGARDTERGGFVMLGKTFKGLTDAMLAWQTERLLALETGRDPATVYVRPELVVEIAFNEIQESPRYPGRLALRFARVKRYRTDKNPARPTRSIPSVRLPADDRVRAAAARLAPLATNVVAQDRGEAPLLHRSPPADIPLEMGYWALNSQKEHLCCAHTDPPTRVPSGKSTRTVFAIDEHLASAPWRTEWAATTPGKWPRAWRLMP